MLNFWEYLKCLYVGVPAIIYITLLSLLCIGVIFIFFQGEKINGGIWEFVLFLFISVLYTSQQFYVDHQMRADLIFPLSGVIVQCFRGKIIFLNRMF